MSIYKKDGHYASGSIQHFRGRAIEVPEQLDWKPEIPIKVVDDVLMLPDDEDVVGTDYFSLYFGEIVCYALRKLVKHKLIIKYNTNKFFDRRVKSIMLGNIYIRSEFIINGIDISFEHDRVTLTLNDLGEK